MSNVAKIDCSAGDCYAQVALGPSSSFKVKWVLKIPAATLAGMAGVSDLSSNLIDFNDNEDLFVINSPGWQYQTTWALSAAGSVTADSYVTHEVDVAFNTGTTWDFVWKVAGSTIITDTGVDMGVDTSSPLTLKLGGIHGFPTNPDEVYYIASVEVKDATDTVVFTDGFAGGTFGHWDTTVGGPVIVDDPGAPTGSPDMFGSAGGVRIGIAFDDVTFEPDPTWTYITALADVTAAAYEIERGKQTEQEQVGTTKLTVNVFDKTGVLDPTNSSSAYYGLIEPLLQIQVELWNPCALEWQSRFRGFIQDYDYVPYPGSRVDPGGVVAGFSALQISAVGIMEPLSAIQLQIGAFGDTPPAGTEGNVFFDNATFQDRITQVWGNAGIDSFWLVAFTGNVEMAESRYAPSDNVMSVVQDAVDAELPTVANAFEDRFGRLACHGRLAEFDPHGTWLSIGADDATRNAVWEFHQWKCGDGSAVAASPSDTAHIRSFAFNRGLANIFNSAYCTRAGIAEADKAGQLSIDPTSIGKYGIRSWSKENLYIDSGLLTGNTGDEETKAFADFIVANFKNPTNRVTDLTFKSMDADDPRAAATWDLLCRVDVSDSIAITITLPGRAADSPNWSLEPFFVQGSSERVTPLNPDYALVETRLDVTPRPLNSGAIAALTTPPG